MHRLMNDMIYNMHLEDCNVCMKKIDINFEIY